MGRSNRREDEFIQGIGEVVLENNLAENKQAKLSQNQGNRKQMSQSREKKRESSGVKKTQIEVLDHETPIEEYQQYYQ